MLWQCIQGSTLPIATYLLMNGSTVEQVHHTSKPQCLVITEAILNAVSLPNCGFVELFTCCTEAESCCTNYRATVHFLLTQTPFLP